jgi:hypothetical protein
MATAAKKRNNQRIDPELLRQLDEHAAAGRPIEAVFTLRTGRSVQKAGKATDTRSAVEALLQRVEAQVGVGPDEYNVFQNLGAFVVVAPPRFVRELMSQDEIATATANRQPSSMMIPPRDKGPV